MNIGRRLRAPRAVRARLTAGLFVFLWETAFVVAAFAFAYAVALLALALV